MSLDDSTAVAPRDVSDLLQQWLSSMSHFPGEGADAAHVATGRGTLSSGVGVATSAVPVSSAVPLSSVVGDGVAGIGFPVNAPLPIAPHTYTVAPAGPRFDAAREDLWESVVVSACGPRGPAVQALAGHLRSVQPALGRFPAVWLSVELLQHEPVPVCETLVVLVRDGWERSLGELLACARSL